MESRNIKSKSVYYLITDTEIYRTDQILKQIDQWANAFQNGRVIQCPYADEASLDEFEAHLEETCLEVNRLVRQDLDF
jgi:hypothetical protein